MEFGSFFTSLCLESLPYVSLWYGFSILISKRETRPTRASVSSSWMGNRAWRLLSANRWLLQQAS